MVVKIVWIQSWVTVSISLCVLLVLILFIIICLCWDGRNSKSQHELYTMEANRLNRTHETINSHESSSAGFFRRISSTSLLKTKLKMPGSDTILANYEKDHHLLPNEKELLDSLDVNKQFDKSVLKIDICDKQLLQQDQDDNKSCDSSDSRRTFYSIYPYSRANSVAETMRSALSCPDVNDY